MHAPIDGAPATFAHQLLRSLPAACAHKGSPPLHRERPTIWPTRELHRFHRQGSSASPIFTALAHLTGQPEPKGTKRTLQTLQAQLAYLGGRANPGSKTKGGDTAGDFAGEYQSLMEQEYFDFVLFEVPWIVL